MEEERRQVDLLLAGLLPGSPDHFLDYGIHGLGLRRLDPADQGQPALQHPPAARPDNLRAPQFVDTGRRNYETGQARLAPGFLHRPTLSLPHILDPLPKLAGVPLVRLLQDSGDGQRPGSSLPRPGRHHRHLLQSRPPAGADSSAYPLHGLDGSLHRGGAFP